LPASLQLVDIEFTAVTGAAIGKLASLPKLKQIQCRGSKAIASGIRNELERRNLVFVFVFFRGF
jgi:hypothetical protein